MKKRFVLMGLAMAMAAVLCSCAQPKEERGTSAVAPSTIALPSSSAGDAQSSSSESSAADSFDSAEFSAYLENSGYAVFLAGELAATSELQGQDGIFSTTGLLTWILNDYYDQNNMPKEPVPGTTDNYMFPISELERVSEEVLGYKYDFSVALTSDMTSDIAKAAPEGYYPRVWNFGPGQSGTIDQGSITMDGTRVSAVIDFTALGTAPWSCRYDFEYHPEYQYSKYTLVSIKKEGGGNEGAKEVTPPEHTRFQAEGKPPYIVDADGGLNMRSGPGTEYESILLIPDGELLTPIGGLEAGGDWEYVRYNGAEGWINRQYAPLYGVHQG